MNRSPEGKERAKTIAHPAAYLPQAGLTGASAFGGKGDHPRSRYYTANDFYHMQSDETLHILTHFQTYQQTTEYTCGAACALMVLNWFGFDRYHERPVAQLVESHITRGSTVENIAALFEVIGWETAFHARPEPKFDSPEAFGAFVTDHIDRGIPIMVDWLDWGGHWQVIIGLDTCGTDTPYDDVLILADPYDVTDHRQDGYYTYPLARFFSMWMEGPCAEKTEPYLHPYVVACPGKAEPKGEQPCI